MLDVDEKSDAIEIDATAAVGMATIQDLFDEGMARLAVISRSWEQLSTGALELTASLSTELVADPRQPVKH